MAFVLDIGRARSALSVSDVDYYLSLPVSCPTSPAASTLTLTPGRVRNIDQDMENLRVSRQDNPFVQVSFTVLPIIHLISKIALESYS